MILIPSLHRARSSQQPFTATVLFAPSCIRKAGIKHTRHHETAAGPAGSWGCPAHAARGLRKRRAKPGSHTVLRCSRWGLLLAGTERQRKPARTRPKARQLPRRRPPPQDGPGRRRAGTALASPIRALPADRCRGQKPRLRQPARPGVPRRRSGVRRSRSVPLFLPPPPPGRPCAVRVSNPRVSGARRGERRRAAGPQRTSARLAPPPRPGPPEAFGPAPRPRGLRRPRGDGGGGGEGRAGRCFPPRRRGRRPAAGERQAGRGGARSAPFPLPPRPEDGSAARRRGWRPRPSSFFFRRRQRRRRRIIVVWEEGSGDGLDLPGLLLRRQHSARRQPAPGRAAPRRAASDGPGGRGSASASPLPSSRTRTRSALLLLCPFILRPDVLPRGVPRRQMCLGPPRSWDYGEISSAH